MSDWFQPHTIVELGGFIITGIAFAWSLSARFTAIETKLDLLMEGRELVKIRFK